MPGTFSPPPRVSGPDMHHGTCVTHVLWSRWRENVPCIPDACATPNFAYLVRGPWLLVSLLTASPGHEQHRYWRCKIGRSFASTKKKCSYWFHFGVEDYVKHIHVSSKHVVCGEFIHQYIHGILHIRKSHFSTLFSMNIPAAHWHIHASYCIEFYHITGEYEMNKISANLLQYKLRQYPFHLNIKPPYQSYSSN